MNALSRFGLRWDGTRQPPLPFGLALPMLLGLTLIFVGWPIGPVKHGPIWWLMSVGVALAILGLYLAAAEGMLPSAIELLAWVAGLVALGALAPSINLPWWLELPLAFATGVALWYATSILGGLVSRLGNRRGSILEARPITEDPPASTTACTPASAGILAR